MQFITNNGETNLKNLLTHLGKKADCIKVASAFFSDTEIINNWLKKNKKIELLISLRPPTNYYSLKAVHSKLGINIQFLGDDFHSKFFIFYDKGHPFAGVIGSSNFTAGGLYKNIETNAVLNEFEYLFEIDKHFNQLLGQSYLLQPSDLESFKKIFENFKKRADQTAMEQKELQKKILTKRESKKKKIQIGKEGKQYFAFWRIVDDVKEMVYDISQKEYPKIPVYITIDHFWHWIKTVWSKEGRLKPTQATRKRVIPKLFKEYCEWDKRNGNYTKKMAQIQKTIFSNFLSETHIDKLKKEEAKVIYASLHSGAMRTRRFGADEKFVTENSIDQIRCSLKYFLYSNNELDVRIHQLCEMNSPYKLNQLKSSGSQELIGWVNPDKYPLRNDKADEALRLLGFKLL